MICTATVTTTLSTANHALVPDLAPAPVLAPVFSLVHKIFVVDLVKAFG